MQGLMRFKDTFMNIDGIDVETVVVKVVQVIAVVDGLVSFKTGLISKRKITTDHFVKEPDFRDSDIKTRSILECEFVEIDLCSEKQRKAGFAKLRAI